MQTLIQFSAALLLVYFISRAALAVRWAAANMRQLVTAHGMAFVVVTALILLYRAGIVGNALRVLMLFIAQIFWFLVDLLRSPKAAAKI